jgi:hypothetical protein
MLVKQKFSIKKLQLLMLNETGARHFKQQVFDCYQQLVNRKVVLLQHNLQDLINSTNNETKSSAGDKYETGRAMLQIEQDNVRKQLKEVLEQKLFFERLDISSTADTIKKGSLVKTHNTYFFVSLGLGKSMVEGVQVIAISVLSPLGQAFKGRKMNESISLNGTTYLIESIE